MKIQGLLFFLFAIKENIVKSIIFKKHLKNH